MNEYCADKEVWRYLQPYGCNTPTCQTGRQTGVWHLACQPASHLSTARTALACAARLKPGHYSLAHNFTKYWPIFKILSAQTQQWPCNILITKHPTAPQKRRYITLWNLSVQKLLIWLTRSSVALRDLASPVSCWAGGVKIGQRVYILIRLTDLQ